MVGFTHIQPKGSLETAKTWFRVALANFLVAAVIGLLLRYAFVYGLSWLNYKPFQDAHSHIALLGWGYQAISACLLATFFSSPPQRLLRYLYWAGQVTVLLLSVNFVLEGTRMVANALTLLFSLIAMLFAWQVAQQLRKQEAGTPGWLFLKPALGFLLLSFLGILLLIPVMLASGEHKLIWFYLCLQFFLHFQYNGWFVFAVLALVFRLASRYGFTPDPKALRRFYTLTFWGTFVTFFLTIYWGYQDQSAWLWIASAGGMMLIAGLLAGWNLFAEMAKKVLPHLMPVIKLLLCIAAICYLVKLVMQIIIIVPFLAYIAFTIRNYVIAFLHLVFLGFLSMPLLGLALHYGLICNNRVTRAGIYILLLGFMAMEGILFTQGTMQWTGFGFFKLYYHFVFYASLFIPAGLLFILTGGMFMKSDHIQNHQLPGR